VTYLSDYISHKLRINLCDPIFLNNTIRNNIYIRAKSTSSGFHAKAPFSSIVKPFSTWKKLYIPIFVNLYNSLMLLCEMSLQKSYICFRESTLVERTFKYFLRLPWLIRLFISYFLHCDTKFLWFDCLHDCVNLIIIFTAFLQSLVFFIYKKIYLIDSRIF